MGPPGKKAYGLLLYPHRTPARTMGRNSSGWRKKDRKKEIGSNTKRYPPQKGAGRSSGMAVGLLRKDFDANNTGEVCATREYCLWMRVRKTNRRECIPRVRESGPDLDWGGWPGFLQHLTDRYNQEQQNKPEETQQKNTTNTTPPNENKKRTYHLI